MKLFEPTNAARSTQASGSPRKDSKFDLEKAIFDRKEEKYFNKEFTKELRKLKNPEKEKKPDIYDRFAEGDMSYAELEHEIEQTKANKKGGVKRIPDSTNDQGVQKLTNFFSGMSLKSDPKAEKSFSDPFLKIEDFLEGIEKDEKEREEEQMKSEKESLSPDKLDANKRLDNIQTVLGFKKRATKSKQEQDLFSQSVLLPGIKIKPLV